MGEVLGYQIPRVATMINEQWATKLITELTQMEIPFDEQAPMRLAKYHEILTQWNAHMNLTGNTDFDDALDRHYVDSFAPLAFSAVWQDVQSLIDVGSGAGFPGMVLAIMHPEWKVVLMDSLQKRVGFLQEVAKQVGLTNVEVIHARAEDGAHMADLREQFDIAVARAVAPLPVLCELLLPFVRVGGQMVCYKGPAGEEERLQAGRSADLLGGGSLLIHPIALPSRIDWARNLITCPKIQKTIPQYPRKAGMPSKKPLG